MSYCMIYLTFFSTDILFANYSIGQIYIHASDVYASPISLRILPWRREVSVFLIGFFETDRVIKDTSGISEREKEDCLGHFPPFSVRYGQLEETITGDSLKRIQ